MVSTHEEDGLVGRVDLLQAGGRRHVDGQAADDVGNGGLHVLRGGVDVAVERELQGYVGAASGGGGGQSRPGTLLNWRSRTVATGPCHLPARSK